MNFAHSCAVRTMSVIVGAVVLLFAGETRAQSPEEHASHHPGAAGTGPAAVAPGMAGMPAAGGTAAPGKGGGMMEGMGEMMKGMGKPPPKELYPPLMALPELSPEQRKQVEAASRASGCTRERC